MVGLRPHERPGRRRARPARAWGERDWTYDRIGNRLTETRNRSATPETDTYGYTLNGTGGNTPLLDEVLLSPSGTADYAWDPAGNLDTLTRGANLLDFTFDGASRMSAIDRASESVDVLYDGRSFLRLAAEPDPGPSVEPLYDSAGLLHGLLEKDTPSGPERRHTLFYLAGRPVAQLTRDGATETWQYLTTDHLGTPVLASDEMGSVTWTGGFEPFGHDFAEGTSSSALASDVFLRFPGQWETGLWADASLGTGGIFYNVHRWYAPTTGRYTRPDPLGIIEGDPNPYVYALGNPIIFIDEFGLATFKNFPPDKQREAERALEQARQKLKDLPCCTGSKELTEELLAKLNDPNLVIVYKPGLRACGKTPFLANVFGRRRFQLGPPAFDPARCCDLASTMVHEISHIGIGGSESEAQQIEKSCFNCPRGR